MPQKYFILPELCFEHLTPYGHPESVYRLEAIKSKFLGVLPTPSRSASREDLLLCHPASYVDLVKSEIEKGYTTLSTGDVEITPKSFIAALAAVGAGLTGIDLLEEGSRVFAAIRPPGHHAERDRGMGFCLFNNIAIAALYARTKLHIQRILIVDWDLHHGNGTEAIFKDDKDIFYFSTHQSPLYPGTGQKSTDHILNFPIPPGKNSRLEVLNAFALLPNAMAKFKPELVLISAGFDAHKLDPLGALDLETEDFGTLTRVVKNIANQYAKGRILSLLEGGYNLTALSESAFKHFEEL